MDPITITFYAVVCGCLSVVAPRFPGLPIRLGVGVAVSIFAASILPLIKDMIGPY
ncbi:MAG: hypothetical protein QNL58_03765 [Octadecabacter sp.]|nr:hypothetical protein [Octadecabacter sp.]